MHLGPILYILFINDMAGLISMISVSADDTKLCVPVNSEHKILALQHDLNKTETWAEKW